MIANTAFLSAMIVLLVVFVLLDQLDFLAAYRRVIVHDYLWTVLASLLLLFLNLFGWIYLAGKRLFLKDTGRKLAHVEKLLHTDHTVVRDLSSRLAREE